MENELKEKIKNKWRTIKDLSAEERSFSLDYCLKEILSLIDELEKLSVNKVDKDKYVKIYSDLETTLGREVMYAQFDYKHATKKRATNQDYLTYQTSLRNAIRQIKMELGELIV